MPEMAIPEPDQGTDLHGDIVDEEVARPAQRLADRVVDVPRVGKRGPQRSKRRTWQTLHMMRTALPIYITS